jgi:ribonuclease HII
MKHQPTFDLEHNIRTKGYTAIAGIDEAGRGALAGPVMAGAVIFADATEILERELQGVRDSKEMTVRQRRAWRARLPDLVLSFGIGQASAAEIDQYGIISATRLAIRRALDSLDQKPDHLLLDHIRLPSNPLPQLAIPKGDQKSLSIAAASILAKTERDSLLIEMGDKYPNYGFERHKGYGTAQHREALETFGPCPAHRRSFAPLRLKLF